MTRENSPYHNDVLNFRHWNKHAKGRDNYAIGWLFDEQEKKEWDKNQQTIQMLINSYKKYWCIILIQLNFYAWWHWKNSASMFVKNMIGIVLHKMYTIQFIWCTVSEHSCDTLSEFSNKLLDLDVIANYTISRKSNIVINELPIRCKIHLMPLQEASYIANKVQQLISLKQ